MMQRSQDTELRVRLLRRLERLVALLDRPAVRGAGSFRSSARGTGQDKGSSARAEPATTGAPSQQG